MLDATAQALVVASANLAPSVHNTQPARWRFDADGTITVLADPTRFLEISDPDGWYAALSCGTAVEGTVMALGDLGLHAAAIEELWGSESGRDGLRPVARIVVKGDGQPFELSSHIRDRYTWRSHFLPLTSETGRALRAWGEARDDVVLAVEQRDREMLAALNDEASVRFYSDQSHRRELVDWMRLSRRHPYYRLDGLNLEALQIGRPLGYAAKLALGKEVYRLLHATGLARTLLSQRSKTMSAAAIILFHRPADESPVVTGRTFYQLWLHLTRLGLAGWPMTMLADDEDSAAQCRTHFGIPEDRRFVTGLRIGVASGQVAHARLPPSVLIVE